MAVATPAAPPRWTDQVVRGVLLVGAILAPFNYVVDIPVGDLTLHPLELWAVALVAVTLLLRPAVLLRAADMPRLLFWTTFAFVATSTVFGTPAEYRTRGFLDVVLLGINLVVFMLTYGHLRTGIATWMEFGRALYWSSLASSTYLVVQAQSIAASGVSEGPDSNSLGLGTVIGTYTAAFTAACMAGMTFGGSRRFRLAMLVGVVIHGLAASDALARGPWIGMGIGFIAAFVLALSVGPRAVRVAVAAARGLAAALLLLAVTIASALNNPMVARLLAPRVLEIANVSSGTGASRLTLFQALLDDALDSPGFGHGAATYRRVSELLGVQGSISENFPLEIFHAGGALAAIPLAIAAAIALLRLARALRVPALSSVAPVCLAGLLALMLASLTNPAAWNASFWILTAMGASLGCAFDVSRPAQAPATTVEAVA